MNESTERALTDAQCDEFRRAPLSFNDMLRAVFEAGRASQSAPSPVEDVRKKALEAAALEADSYGDWYMVQAREGDNTGASDHKACAAVEIADAIRALAQEGAKE